MYLSSEVSTVNCISTGVKSIGLASGAQSLVELTGSSDPVAAMRKLVDDVPGA